MSLPRCPRVLMISTHGYVAARPELGRPDTGGQVVYVLELSKYLARMGCQVDIATRQFEDQPAREEVAAGVRLLRFPCGGPAFIAKETLCEFIPAWVASAQRYFRRQKLTYDVINSHYWDAGMAGRLLAPLLGSVHVHTPHSLGTWKRDNMPGTPAEKERRWNFSRRIEEEARVYATCSALVATTFQQREVMASDYGGLDTSKIGVVPPGYDDTRFYPVSPATRQLVKRDLGLEGRIVLALGRLARNKGYDLLIRAMAPVFARCPDVKLLLAVGSTSLSDDERGLLAGLKAVAREMGVEDRVLFRDYIPDELLASYYRAADVFALSSRYEPFGMTAIEAMACGTPTVMTTQGGLCEQVAWGVEAIYADPNDPEVFGHSIYDVLSLPHVSHQLATKGAEKVRARFTWSAVAQQVLELMAGCRAAQSAPAQETGFKDESAGSSRFAEAV